MEKDLEKQVQGVNAIALALAEVMAKVAPHNEWELEIILASGITSYLIEWMKFQKFTTERAKLSLKNIGTSISSSSSIVEKLFENETDKECN